MPAPYTLILLRHGQSLWNQQNLFTGWVDVRLSEQGIIEARRVDVGFRPIPDVVDERDFRAQIVGETAIAIEKHTELLRGLLLRRRGSRILRRNRRLAQRHEEQRGKSHASFY